MKKPAPSIDKSDLENAEAWDIPHVEDPNDPVESRPTNALNLRSGWKYEPPEEVEEIKPPTAEEIEAIRDAAYKEGYEEGKEAGFAEGRHEGLQEGREEGMKQGLEQGHEEGLESGKQVAEDMAQTLENLVEHLYAPLAQMNGEVKQQVTHLAAVLARAVVHTELSTNGEVIKQALDKGLAALPLNEQSIQVYLNPEDIPVLYQFYSPDVCQEKGWDIRERSSLSRGGCEIVTQNNAVDVSIEKRTRDVIDQFLLNHGLSSEPS